MNRDKLLARIASNTERCEAIMQELDAASAEDAANLRDEWDQLMEDTASAEADVQRLEAMERSSNFMDSTPGRATTPTNRGGVEVVNEQAPFQTLAEFMQAVKMAGCEQTANHQTSEQLRNYNTLLMEQAAASGMTETGTDTGGFLLAPQMANDLMTSILNGSVFARKCRYVPVGAASNSLTYPDVKEDSRKNGARFGGVQAYWEDEEAEMTRSQPQFDENTLKLRKVTALFRATDELLEDAVGLAGLVDAFMGEEFAIKVDDAIFRGNGTKRPLGIMEAPALVSVPKEKNQSAATIKYNNILAMYSRFDMRFLQGAEWNINQDCLPQLMQMSINVGTGGQPVWMPPNAAADSPFGRLMGIPVIPTEHNSTVGTMGDITLANWDRYMLIGKGNIQSASSIHVNFESNRTSFRWTLRRNGQPIRKTAYIPMNGTNTISPFVALATRS